MKRRSRKLKPKSSGENQRDVGTNTEISPAQPLPKIALMILLTGAGLVFSVTWIGILLIFNPEKVTWLNNVLPVWAKIDLGESENPQTIAQIQLNLTERGKIPGETIPVDRDNKSFILPVMHLRPNCESDCQELAELRVYQLENLNYKTQPEKFYRLANTLTVTGPDESFASTSLANPTSETSEVANPLPLTKVERFEKGTPTSGTWLNLQGERSQGDQAITYGQIIYYNPERNNLHPMLSWKSPNQQPLKWQQVTGDKRQELVIDQTIGVEPRLQVYQVKSVNLYLKPIELEAISLDNSILKDSTYQNALLLSRNGLWTPAREIFQSVRQRRGNSLPASAQAQLDVISLHAELTTAQANKTWASPSQQVLADLIDGRWDKALEVFRSSPQNAQEIASMLKVDQGRLWDRVEAALQVNPNDKEVQAWGALILASQQGDAKATSWLQQQQQTTTATVSYIQDLLKQVNPNLASNQDSTNNSESQP